MSLKSQLYDAAKKCSRSTDTLAAKQKTVREFVRLMKLRNIQIRRAAKIRQKFLVMYGEYLQQRVSEGEIQPRTAINRLSHMRTIMRELGRSRIADCDALHNRAFGLSGVSRKGTNQPIKESDLQAACRNVPENIAAALLLQRALGLRLKEAVMGGNREQLLRWHRDLTCTNKVFIGKGTKGGRARVAYFLSTHMWRRALWAVKNALIVLDCLGCKNLIAGANYGLKSALGSYRHYLKKAGLTRRGLGVTSHSLRYAFTQECVDVLIGDGFTRSQALALTSTFLGHGDGRGVWVNSVYLQNKRVDRP